MYEGNSKRTKYTKIQLKDARNSIQIAKDSEKELGELDFDLGESLILIIYHELSILQGLKSEQVSDLNFLLNKYTISCLEVASHLKVKKDYLDKILHIIHYQKSLEDEIFDQFMFKKVLVILNNLIIGYINNRVMESKMVKLADDWITKTVNQLKNPSPIGNLYNSVVSYLIQKGQYFDALEYTRESINLVSDWIKSKTEVEDDHQSTKEDKKMMVSNVKVFILSLLNRAILVRKTYSSLCKKVGEKNAKKLRENSLVQAKILCNKHLDHGSSLSQAIEREIQQQTSTPKAGGDRRGQNGRTRSKKRAGTRFSKSRKSVVRADQENNSRPSFRLRQNNYTEKSRHGIEESPKRASRRVKDRPSSTNVNFRVRSRDQSWVSRSNESETHEIRKKDTFSDFSQGVLSRTANGKTIDGYSQYTQKYPNPIFQNGNPRHQYNTLHEQNVQELKELNQTLASQIQEMKMSFVQDKKIEQLKESFTEVNVLKDKIDQVSKLQQSLKTDKEDLRQRISRIEVKLQKEKIFNSEQNNNTANSQDLTPSSLNSKPLRGNNGRQAHQGGGTSSFQQSLKDDYRKNGRINSQNTYHQNVTIHGIDNLSNREPKQDLGSNLDSGICKTSRMSHQNDSSMHDRNKNCSIQERQLADQAKWLQIPEQMQILDPLTQLLVVLYQKSIEKFKDEYKSSSSSSNEKSKYFTKYQNFNNISVRLIYEIFVNNEHLLCLKIEVFELNPQESTTNLEKKLKTQIFSEKEIQMILINSTNIEEVCPLAYPLTCFTSIEHIIYFFITPYLELKNGDEISLEEKKLELKISDKFNNLMDNTLKMSFQGSQHLITFQYMGYYNFRILIKNPKNPLKKSIALELLMDDISFKKYFKGIKEANTQFEALNDSKNSSKISKEKKLNFSKSTQFSNNSIILKRDKLDQLKVYLESVIRNFQDYVKFMEISDHDITRFDKIFMIKTINIKTNYHTVYEAYETPLEESFILKARNTFETYSKYKLGSYGVGTVDHGQKIKEISVLIPKIKEIASSLGLDYQKLDIQTKKYVWQIYVKRTSCIYFESQPISLPGDKSSKDTEISYRTSRSAIGKTKQQSKQLRLLNMDFLRTYECFLEDSDYRVRLCTTFIGIYGEIVGIKMQMYTPECSGVPKAYFIPFNVMPFFKENQKPKRVLRQVPRSHYNKNFKILQIFNYDEHKTMVCKIVSKFDDKYVIGDMIPESLQERLRYSKTTFISNFDQFVEVGQYIKSG